MLSFINSIKWAITVYVNCYWMIYPQLLLKNMIDHSSKESTKVPSRLLNNSCQWILPKVNCQKIISNTSKLTFFTHLLFGIIIKSIESPVHKFQKHDHSWRHVQIQCQCHHLFISMLVLQCMKLSLPAVELISNDILKQQSVEKM